MISPAILEYLQRRNLLGLQVLEICAFLAPESIPIALFERGVADAEFELQELAQDASLLDQTLTALRDLGVITLYEQTKIFDVHPPAQEALRQERSPDEQQHIAEQVLRALYQLILSLDENDTIQRQCCLTHIQYIATLTEDWTLTLPKAADLFSWAAGLLCEEKNYQAAAFLLRRTLTIWTRLLGPAHRTVTTVMHNLAAILEKCQEYDEAESLLHRTITTRARTLGVSHPETLLSLNNLGYIYARQNKEKEAEASYAKALSLARREPGQKHPVIAELQHNLATFYYDRGKFAEAEPWLEQVCAIWEQSKGTEHLDTARIWHKLAVARVALDKWSQAETLYLRVLPIYQRDLGARHPETVQCLEELTLLYALQNKAAEAQIAMQQIRAIREEQARGTNTQETLIGLSGLAGIQFGQGHLSEAEASIKQTLEVIARDPRLGRPAEAVSIGLLATIYADQGKHEQALTLLRETLLGWKQDAQPDDLQIALLSELYEELLAEAQQTTADPSSL